MEGAGNDDKKWYFQPLFTTSSPLEPIIAEYFLYFNRFL